MFKRHRTSMDFKKAVKKYGNPPAVIPNRVEVYEGEEEQWTKTRERLSKLEGGSGDEH